MKYFLPLALLFVLVGCDTTDTVESAQATAANASDNAAFVLNSGRDGLTCTLSGGGTFGGGSGSANVVSNNGGNTKFTCSGELNFPDMAPDRATQIGAGGPLGTSCTVTITPSGRFSAHCHN